MKKGKLATIIELIEHIKLYASGISDIYENIDINPENIYFKNDTTFLIGLEIDGLLLDFKIGEQEIFYIDMSEDEWEELNEIVFWQTMYFKSRRMGQ